ncbi:uncharacterized protein LOC142639808 [Castanea sativa]|uniref:uncharacterized protein LOC142639808 n=1 Tax=Castanea sativa TaxID=21020 RepID=UPI003F64BFE7
MARSYRIDNARSLPPKPPHLSITASQRPIWKPPPWPNLKVNSDGSCFRGENLAGAGAIIRDANGQVLTSMADKFLLPHFIVAVEVIAAIKALRFAIELGLTSIILEGDSKIAINAMLCKVPMLAEYGHLIEEAKLLADQFVSVEFSHVPRQCNSLAHNIATHARHVSMYTV